MKKKILVLLVLVITIVGTIVINQFVNYTEKNESSFDMLLFDDIVQNEEFQIALVNDLKDTYGNNYLDVINKNVESTAYAKKIDDLFLENNNKEKIYPDYYGGVYINDNQELVFQYTDYNQFSQNKLLSSELKNIDNNMIYENVKFSYNELKTTYNNILSLIKKNKIQGLNGFYIDVKNNRIVVELNELSIAENFKDKILDSNMVSFAKSEPYRITSTHNIGGPLKAYDNVVFCSMGFRAKYNGKTGIITAGHCVVDNETLPFGHVEKVQFSGSVDAAWIKSTETLTNNLEYQTYPRTTIKTNTTMPYLAPGSLLGKVGYASHAVTGTLISLNHTVFYDKEVNNLDHDVTLTDMGYANLTTRPLDSGGAVFTFSNSNNSSASLVGITSGGVFEQNSDISSVVNFTKLNNILNGLGVTRY